MILQLDVNGIGGDAMHLYYPVLLVSLTGFVMLNPLQILRHRVRMTLVQSLVGAQDRVQADLLLTIRKCRLFCAVLCAVHASDAYLGDMCCSLTYTFAVSGDSRYCADAVQCNV